MAKAPNARIGATFSSSLRDTRANLRSFILVGTIFVGTIFVCTNLECSEFGSAVSGCAILGAGRGRLCTQVNCWLGDFWSPEQVAKRLRLEFPDDPSMWVSHETIYQSLFVQGRGELRREPGRGPRPHAERSRPP